MAHFAASKLKLTATKNNKKNEEVKRGPLTDGWMTTRKVKFD